MRSRCRCSMCPAIHINSRSWLRSSSTPEPSDPPLRVVKKRCQIRPTGQHSTRAPRFGHEDRTPRLLRKKHSFTKRSYLGAYNIGPMTDEARQYSMRPTFHKARSRRSSSSVFEVTEPVRLRHPKRRPPLRKGRRVGALSTSPRPSRGALGEEPFSLSDRLVRLP